MALVRLQKYLADSGVASRRQCEELIVQGRVSIDGEQIRTLGVKVDPEISKVMVDGELIKEKKSKTYIAFYKPRGVLSSMNDENGRTDLTSYIPEKERLFHVGRLDKESEGLLLLTNDGNLTHKATHPSYGLSKKYLVEVESDLDNLATEKLLRGVELEDGIAKVDSLKKVRTTTSGSVWFEVVIHEGRNHIIRRMFDSLGGEVVQLIRTEFGPIHLGELNSGRYRHLSEVELNKLFKALNINL